MEITQPPLVTAPSTDNKRQCIKIKARIRINGDQLPSQSVIPAQQPYQAYCETITSSRPQSPDFFTSPPTQQSSSHPPQNSIAPTYTARIIHRKREVSNVVSSQHPDPVHNTPTTSLETIHEGNKQNVSANCLLSEREKISASQQRAVSQSTIDCGSHLGAPADHMPRNRTLSLSQVQQESLLSNPTTQTITTKTPLRQKRYGRMEHRPLPPLPSLPPEVSVDATIDQRDFGQRTVNFSRGEIEKKTPKVQEQTTAPHLACVNAYIPPPTLPPPGHHHIHLPSATIEHERPLSKASRQTVTFADNSTLSSRSSSLDHHSIDHTHHQVQALRQSKSFSTDTQIPSSLRLYRSHDSLLVTNGDGTSKTAHASRRTMPKDSKHKYIFGQRPASKMILTPGLGRASNQKYNPRLSTSKAQYRGLQTLPRPLPSSLRVGEPQTGPRQPPWGSLEDLEEQREKRGDARERVQAKQFRSATLSQATTVGSTDSFGKEKMKKEVEEYKEQVMSVYPDMTFDGNAGRGGRRSCCCVVM
ncbi:uncharacterized protein EKO05_0003354 [Ascochyta rabiei]|uniref:uncharacterized protein n=1 Tax=Didymella rabiei TaxID=5454 RepID=UPI0021FCB924|nr:uncharacterized protein EKO05_0003354 [Ascochyta rabiei]UPX12818.1 hypothetical protein EKO05_0003354 [Ascochyta rabiei]